MPKREHFQVLLPDAAHLQPLEKQADRLGCKSQQNVFQQFKEFNKCCWLRSWNNYLHVYPWIYTKQIILFHKFSLKTDLTFLQTGSQQDKTFSSRFFSIPQ